ncbi:sensor histidine kinase [Phytoactinopolyspora limicola]|uniref:sensor histidine kinase n=1 Tax=Phytoactinopolyspora limicola TaxID=2715536 RepID=UPI00140855BB|nr:histidine kinase [Phytoactinopolyspora limicola]
MVDDPGRVARSGTGARSAARRPWAGLVDVISVGIAGASNQRAVAKGALTLFGIGALLWGMGITTIWPAAANWLWPERPDGWWHLVTLAIACAAVLLYRTRLWLALSVAVAVAAVDLTLGGSLGVVIVLWELLFAVGLSGSVRLRQVVIRTVFVIISAATIAAGIATSDLRIGVYTALQVGAVLALPLWWASNVRQKSELAELESRRAADLERIGELRRSEAVQTERNAIARDLHDAIASRLSTVAIQSAAALATPTSDHSAALNTIRSEAVGALQEMRSMIVVLRSAPPSTASHITDTGTGTEVVVRGIEQIDELVAAARRAGLRVDLHSTVDPADDGPDPADDETDPADEGSMNTPIPVAVAQACYRIVQEALVNAAKHAPTSDVQVRLSREPGEVHVVVENTLTGAAELIDPALSAGTGLVTMRERAEALGGWFTAGPPVRAGDHPADVSTWRVEARLAVPADSSTPGGRP